MVSVRCRWCVSFRVSYFVKWKNMASLPSICIHRKPLSGPVAVCRELLGHGARGSLSWHWAALTPSRPHALTPNLARLHLQLFDRLISDPLPLPLPIPPPPSTVPRVRATGVTGAGSAPRQGAAVLAAPPALLLLMLLTRTVTTVSVSAPPRHSGPGGTPGVMRCRPCGRRGALWPCRPVFHSALRLSSGAGGVSKA
ncbi:hypothetical protein E2C01_042882 [Portunus trituberculatus]|uniref:Uncharacterized protein n=1 Tax=Portunus trituberculatus TaxID=210409 RepID=A0A5B7FVY9_PORTR|nr:hypothetical protein [Portunus trituberculatus]